MFVASVMKRFADSFDEVLRAMWTLGWNRAWNLRTAFIVSFSGYRYGSTIRRQEPETARLCRRNDSTEPAQG
jgi:hypothetical protein